MGGRSEGAARKGKAGLQKDGEDRVNSEKQAVLLVEDGLLQALVVFVIDWLCYGDL